MNQGYFSQPDISQSGIAFISDDDLWVVAREGGKARRLTAHRGFVATPCFSPSGEWIAYQSSDSAYEHDIHVIPSGGGESRRLTWIGVQKLIGWKDEHTILFTSNNDGYARREIHIYELDIKSLDFKKINLGPMSYYYQGKGFQVLARNSGDSARWKRYQGGTAGVVWTQQGKSPFKRILKNIKTNITKPVVVERTIYFISDHEGIGNVYSCDLDGNKLKRLTNHLEFYCRNLRNCESTLVYQAGAEIFTYDLEAKTETKINIDCATTAIQSVERFENWSRYFDGAAITNSVHELALVSRGQMFHLQPYSGPVKIFDRQPDVRFVHPNYTHDEKHIVVATSSSQKDEQVLCFKTQDGSHKVLSPSTNWGKVWEIKNNPKKDVVAITNNRNELFILDLKKNSAKKIATNKFSRQQDLDWSPDGRYLAFSAPLDERRTAIMVYDHSNSKVSQLLEPINNDLSPSFDPEGKYLYFMAVREFAPNYNETHFDLGFPFAFKPYAVALNSKVRSPLEINLENPVPAAKEDPKKGKNKKTPELKVEIEFEGIDSRVVTIPVEPGGYEKVWGVVGGVNYLRRRVEPISTLSKPSAPQGPSLYNYKFEDAKEQLLLADINYATSNLTKSHLLVFSGGALRILDAKVKPSDEKSVSKKTGLIDASRIKLRIEPKQEWKQVYREAWVLQKEHFWRQDMSKIDWEIVYKRYLKLLAKVRTRAEFSDLMWEMQGELGTSHCYEMMGDYNRGGAAVTHGRLGGYFKFNAKEKSFVVDRVLKGDSWLAMAESPISAIGSQLQEGDKILAVDGAGFITAQDLYRELENKSDTKVQLTVHRKGQKNTENIVVKPVRSQAGAWYRDWVEKNRKYVHEKSKGKLGYVHIPDMGVHGYAEFYRNFITESRFEGLVVDVRFNGGGHVSQHLLKVLAQKILGYDETRYQGTWSYPSYAPGALVALANEYSGSDGDIFPQSFKLMKLGKLIGKRTWGGVIGINGQYRLRDGTWVTQPEYSFWFRDDEWYIENHGVAPDIEVDISPEEYSKGIDPQLDKGIEECLKEIKRNPSLKFKPTYYPDLSLPAKLARLKE